MSRRMYDICGLGLKPLYIKGKLAYDQSLMERTAEDKPIPLDYGFGLDDLRDYEDKIEGIESTYPHSNDLQVSFYKLAFGLFVVTLIILCCIGFEHSLWCIPIGLLEWGLCHLIYKYLDNKNYNEWKMRLGDVRIEKIERYIRDYYKWLGKTNPDFKREYCDIV